mmetsp:Transcript_81103/g.173447  ORF Transcript_81103/g.173447 Transcript_81103/m.173447 type:complete len:145 (+) Transcript_81103:111-545(+)
MGQTSCCSQKLPEDSTSVSSGVVAQAHKEEVVESKQLKVKEPAILQSKEADPVAPVEFKIILKKTADNKRLGIDVDLSDGTTLYIAKVTGDGLVGEWNRANPQSFVKQGDRIMSVNGCRDSSEAMSDECKASNTLEMDIQRTTP